MAGELSHALRCDADDSWRDGVAGRPAAAEAWAAGAAPDVGWGAAGGCGVAIVACWSVDSLLRPRGSQCCYWHNSGYISPGCRGYATVGGLSACVANGGCGVSADCAVLRNTADLAVVASSGYGAAQRV